MRFKPEAAWGRMGISQNEGYLFGGPHNTMIRTKVFWGLYWGPLILRKYVMWLQVPVVKSNCLDGRGNPIDPSLSPCC